MAFSPFLKKFLLGAALWALVPAFYLVLWHGCRHAGLAWPAVLDLPGLLILALAWPWSTSAFELVFFHGRAVGGAGSVLIHVAVIAGFGVNVSLLAMGVRWLLGRVAAPTASVPGDAE